MEKSQKCSISFRKVDTHQINTKLFETNRKPLFI